MNIPIYANSLARATDRRTALKARLDTAGVKYEIVDAIDGKTDISEWKDKIRHDIAWRIYGRKMSPGRCGNYFSHYRFWQRIAKMDVPAALILEDDVVWNDDFFSVINELVNCEWEWDLVNLAGGVFSGCKYKHKIKTKICELPVVQSDTKYVLCHFLRPRHSSMAYLVTPAGAAKLAAHAIPMRISIDKYWNEVWHHKVRHYNLDPPAAFHSEVETTLDLKNSGGRTFLIKCSAWLNTRIRTYRRRWFYFTHPPKLREPGDKK